MKIKNGSVLIGKIIKVHKDQIYLKTDYAGLLIIDADKVASYSTDEAVQYRTATGKVIKEAYDSQVTPRIKTLWTESDPDLFHNEWERTVWLDYSRRSGNSTSSNLSGGFRIVLDREFDSSKVYGRFIRNQRGEIKTADEKSLGFDFEKRFGEESRNSWYFRAEFEQDRIEDLSLRSTFGSGYGYYLVKNNDVSLRSRLGVLYRQEAYYNDDSQKSLALDIGLLYKQKIYKNVKWVTEVTYSPAFDESGNYRVVHESAIEIPLRLDFELTLKSGIEHTYNSVPSDERQALDTRFFTRLELSF